MERVIYKSSIATMAMDFVSHMLSDTMRGYINWLVVFAVLTPIELLIVRQYQPLAVRIRGLLYWGIAIPASVTCFIGLSALWSALGVRPLISLSAIQAMGWAGPLAAVLAPLLGAFVGDFIGYWYHRAQHRWLWRFHAVHHSIENLNAVNSYHHISDAVFNTLLVMIPTSLLIVDYGTALPLLAFLLWVQPVFLHSPTKLHFGPVRAIFADNRFHRIHHSREEHHFDTNFGALSTLWDRLFGTAYFPGPHEWPDVGLADMPEPRSVRQWLDFPMRCRS